MPVQYQSGAACAISPAAPDSMPEFIPEITTLSSVISRYDAVISDVWGVLHNGIVATPGAQEALAAARAGGCAVVLLTNAPRPPDSIARQLEQLAIGSKCYDHIVSSGGVTRALLEKEGDAPFFHLGPARDEALYRGLKARQVPLDQASLILCTGPFDDENETAEDYRGMMEAALTRKLRLFCANPDLIVERGDRLIPCAGAIADLYEKMGGEVIWVGKPRAMVYSIVYEKITAVLGKKPDAARILCIGDAFRTDIAGAGAGGHDSIMTLAGIHAHQIGLSAAGHDRQALAELADQNGARPTMCMASLAW